MNPARHTNKSSSELSSRGSSPQAPAGESQHAKGKAPPHDAFVAVGTETSADIVGNTQFACLLPPAPTCPSIGLPMVAPFAGHDGGGIFTGLNHSDGKVAHTHLIYGSESWFSAHTETGYRQASGNELRGGGFVGTDGWNFGQVSVTGSHYNFARRIGTRLGGGVFLSCKKSTVDVTDSLKPRDRLPEGTRLLRTTHVRRRFNLNAMLGFAALSFLRLFFRIERRRPATIVWDRLETDPAKVHAATGAGKHPLRVGIADRLAGLRDEVTAPALRDCMERLSDGESLTYTCAEQRQTLAMLGICPLAGRQKHALVRSQAKVTKVNGQLRLTLQRITDDSRSWFGIIPGGALTAREWHTPTVETWTYAFDANQVQSYQRLIDGAFEPERRGVLKQRLKSGLGKEQLQEHVETVRGSQSQNELGLHMMMPRWLAKRWLPKHVEPALGNHLGTLSTTVRVTPKEGVPTLVETHERRRRAARGAAGLQQEILTSRLIRPEADDGDLGTAHLLLRVKHKRSHASPQTVQREVLAPLASMLGASIGSLAAADTPALASPHAVNVGLDLKVPQLVALAGFHCRDLPDALPDPRLRRALQDCIDSWGGPEKVAGAPLQAFASLRDLVQRTIDSSAQDGTLLVGALGYLLDQAGQQGTLQLTHKAALYREPAKLASTLQAKYHGRPIAGVQDARQRFGEVRQALVRCDYARYLLEADNADPSRREQYQPAIERAVTDLRALLRVDNDAEREHIASTLQAAWLPRAIDAYILAVLCADKPEALPQDPLRRGKALRDSWSTFAHAGQREVLRQELTAALAAQSACMGEPGFPYPDETTRRLRQERRTLKGQLNGLQ